MQTTDYSGAIVPSIGSRVMHYVDYDIGTVVDRVEIRPMHWDIRVRWDSMLAHGVHWPTMNHAPDELYPFCAACDAPLGTNLNAHCTCSE